MPLVIRSDRHDREGSYSRNFNYRSTLPFKDLTNASVWATSGNDYYATLESETLKQVDSLYFRFKVTETGGNSMVLPPTPYFIEYIDFQTEQGSGGIMQRFFSDEIMWLLCSMYNSSKMRDITKDMHIDPDSMGINYRKPHKASATKYYFLHIPHNLIDLLKPYVKNWSSSERIRVRIVFRTSLVVSGSGTPRLDEVRFGFTGKGGVSSDQLKQQKIKLTRQPQLVRYLHTMRINNSVSIEPGEEIEIDLKTLKGKSASYLLFSLRQGTTVSPSTNLLNFQDLGDGFVDIVDNSGAEIFSKTATLASDYMRETSRILPGDVNLHHKMYCIPFTDELWEATFDHNTNGFYKFKENDKLRIKAPAVGVSEVQTVDLSSSATSGIVRFSYKGEFSDYVAYNASAAAAKTAIEAIPSVKAENLTVTASGAINADFTLTILKNAQPAEIGHLFTLHGETSDGYANTSITTQGVDGWLTGSNTYTYEIYCFYFRQVINKGDGIYMRGVKEIWDGSRKAR